MKFTIPEKDGYLYISLETYFLNTIPRIEDCFDHEIPVFMPLYDLVIY